MPRPSALTTPPPTTVIGHGDAPTSPPQHALMLREQILRLKAKAFELADATAACDDSFREAQPNESLDDDSSLPPPPQHHLRLKRRLPVRDTERCMTARCSPRHDSSATVTADADNDRNDDEFTGPGGCFKLPRLLHPVLKRQNATAGIKREHEPLTQSPRATSFARPSRMLPCVTARAIALRLVQ